MTNAGIAAAAGVVPGAWLDQPGTSNAVVRECGLSRKPEAVEAGASAIFWTVVRQGSRTPLACLRVVPGTSATTKGLTGLCQTEDRAVGGWSMRPSPRLHLFRGWRHSGLTRLLREKGSPVAADWRWTVDVCFPHDDCHYGSFERYAHKLGRSNWEYSSDRPTGGAVRGVFADSFCWLWTGSDSAIQVFEGRAKQKVHRL